jgi:hypothetical protein
MRKEFLFLIVAVFCAGFVSASSSVTFHYDYDENDSSIIYNGVIRSSAVMFQVTTDVSSVCKFSVHDDVSYGNMEKTFDLNLETIHKKAITELDEGVQTYYVRCKNESGFVGGELETKFSVSLPVSAKIVLDDGDVVKTGKTEVEVVTSKVLSEKPSLSYSFDGISYDPIPLFGSGTSWKGYLMISGSSVEEVGSFKFQGRDLEGALGTEITSGGIFLVDTKRPDTITDFKAEGGDGEVELNWYVDEGDIKEYRIYRSTSNGVGKSDLYKTVDGKSYVDTNVERGVTYYYRINAVDEAENEGDLSREVYATVLLGEVKNSQTGLELRLHGLVDGALSDIDLALDDVKDVKQRFEAKSGVEGELYEGLKLARDIDSAISEIGSLRKEVENYKNQRLSNSELDRKLNSAQLKLSTIKRKVPENLIIVSENSFDQTLDEQDLLEVILQIKPEASEKLSERMVKASESLAESGSLRVRTKGYNVEIVSLAGTREEISLVKEEVDSVLENNESVFLLEVVPRGIASSVSDLEIKNVNYDVVKDSVISFAADTKEITYELDGHIDLSELNRIKTLVYVELEEQPEKSLLTGYAGLVDFEGGASIFGLVVGFVIVLGLVGYFVFIRRSGEAIGDGLMAMKQNIGRAEQELQAGRPGIAHDIYNAVAYEYKSS